MKAETGSLPWFPVLMYHRVSPDFSAGDPYGLCVPVSEFRAQMEFLVRHGYQAMSVEAAAREVAARPGRVRPVAITFDDGYLDISRCALPLLMDLGVTATVFLVSGLAGKTNQWDRGRAAEVRLMGTPEIRELQRAGFSVGSHSATHRGLDGLGLSDARQEIHGSKQALEDALGAPVRAFAFPYGRSTPAVRRLVAEAGYTVACGIEHSRFERFDLSRIDAARLRSSSPAWRFKLSGLYFHLSRRKRSFMRLHGRRVSE